MSIIKIFSSIASAPAEKKIEAITSMRAPMVLIEKDVHLINLNFDKRYKKLQEVLNKTVSLEGLEFKL
jgi:hypothetical protein